MTTWLGGPVVTIEASPLTLSLFPNCMAFILNDATGIRSAIVKRWIVMNGMAAEWRGWRLEGLEGRARGDVEPVTKMDGRNERGV